MNPQPACISGNHRTLALTLLAIFAFTVCSCEPIASLTQKIIQAYPNEGSFSIGANTTDYGKSKQACVEVSEEKFWEPGDGPNALSNYLADTAQITVDGQLLSRAELAGTFIDLSLYPVIKDRQIIGSYGGSISFCFNIDNLSTGHHTVTITLTTMSGLPHSSSLDFQKQSTDQAKFPP